MSKQRVVKIRKLGLGSVFGFKRGDYIEQWKIIGRPGKDGANGFAVKAIFVPYGAEDPYSPGKEAKYFDINTEVIEIAPPKKDFDAIDRRDQPEAVESVEKLAREVGSGFVDTGDLENLIDEEEPAPKGKK